MDHTKVMQLAEKVGGLFRLTVLLQKRVRELVSGSPRLVQTDETDPINIAMQEIEEDAIELVDLSDEELAALEAETQMASEEAELLEALRSRVSRGASADKPDKPDKPEKTEKAEKPDKPEAAEEKEEAEAPAEEAAKDDDEK